MSKWLSGVLGVLFLACAGFNHAHTPVYVASGILGGLAAIASPYWARLYLWTVGLFYLAASVAGFIAGQVLDEPLTTLENYLHLAVAAVALYAVFAEDPHLGTDRIPITGRRGVTDFREPAHRY